MSPPIDSTPNTITAHPGSGDFLLAEDGKGIRVAVQLHKPTMAEKLVSAIMSDTSPLPLSLSPLFLIS